MLTENTPTNVGNYLEPLYGFAVSLVHPHEYGERSYSTTVDDCRLMPLMGVALTIQRLDAQFYDPAPNHRERHAKVAGYNSNSTRFIQRQHVIRQTENDWASSAGNGCSDPVIWIENVPPLHGTILAEMDQPPVDDTSAGCTGRQILIARDISDGIDFIPGQGEVAIGRWSTKPGDNAVTVRASWWHNDD